MRHIKDIYPLVNEVRQRIIEKMRAENIVLVQFCPANEEEYLEEHQGEEHVENYEDYRDNHCPYVIWFDKYNSGEDCCVFSVSFIDGEHPRFKMQCEGECDYRELWDDDVAWLTMLNVYECLERELGLDEQDEPQKVWVLTNHAATECEYLGTNNRVFAKKEDALKALAEWKKDEEVYVKRYDWDVCNDTPEHYEACEEGDYCANHTEGFINEYEVA